MSDGSSNVSKLYVAGENIPAGFDVIEAPGVPELVYGVGLIGRGLRGPVIGTAGASLREGFRVVVRDGEVFEDDA